MDKNGNLTRAVDLLLRRYCPTDNILDPCCGNMQIAHRLKSLGYNVMATDYVNGYGKDFLSTYLLPQPIKTIITFPPKTNTEEYVMHALNILPIGGECAMLIRTSFLEGQKRYEKIFKRHPPYAVYQCSSRIDETRTAYSWMIWRKGLKANTILEWI